MKAITIHQPWAWAIAQGHKRVENRSWATRYRGPILIHAGQSLKSMSDGRAMFDQLGITMPAEAELVRGYVVAVARLVDCVPIDRVKDQPFAEGPWCWMLEGAQAVEPFRLNGMQGLFNVASDVVDQILGVGSVWSGRIGIAPSFPGW